MANLNEELYEFTKNFEQKHGVRIFFADEDLDAQLEDSGLSKEDATKLADEYYNGAKDIEKKYQKESDPEKEEKDFYTIRVTEHTIDGPSSYTVDVRELSFDQLRRMVRTFPQFLPYFVKQLFKGN